MANFPSYFLFNRLALAFALGSFAPVAAFPDPNYQMQFGLNDVAVGVRGPLGPLSIGSFCPLF